MDSIRPIEADLGQIKTDKCSVVLEQVHCQHSVPNEVSLANFDHDSKISDTLPG